MYKVEEIADIIGISRQTVYNVLNRSNDERFTIMVKGNKRITEVGLEHFKKLYNVDLDNPKETQSNEEAFTEFSNDFVEDIKALYKDIINQKDEIILQKNKDIEYLKKENLRLIDVIEQQNKLVLNTEISVQKALSNTEKLLIEKKQELEERKKQFDENSNVNNKNWFSKLFNPKK